MRTNISKAMSAPFTRSLGWRRLPAALVLLASGAAAAEYITVNTT
jgi:hypothetical protein